jgi:cellulose synthase/poly-beta-1,6-N-acetylglucosamine synthase-like glycosyltransferase
MQALFWFALAVIFYAYLGYGLLMAFLARRGRATPVDLDDAGLPPLTLIVPAYNELAALPAKLANCRALDYPRDRLRLLFVTDGSTDGSDALLVHEPGVTVLHDRRRLGKATAMNRAMQVVDTPIAVFSDANVLLNAAALRRLARHFVDPRVGCVAGEKRVQARGHAAAGAGENFYWRYESTVKRWEAAVGSVMGAAGELFALRRDLYAPLPPDTLIDDFVLSFRVAMAGYRLAYEPDAYGVEAASMSVAEEWKRKRRIAAGGIQAILWLAPLLNPFRYGFLSFQYISHRVLRWTLVPLLLALLIPVNAWLAWRVGGVYTGLGLAQLLFYLAAWLGWRMEARGLRWKLLYVPYYFTMMNLAVFAGAWRYARGRQSVLWEKAQRTPGDA